MLAWISSPRTTNRRFIFLDRDGVLNENRSDYVKNAREFVLYPDALEALAYLAGKQISVIVISNQSGLGRGIISWEDFWEMHHAMIRQVGERGGNILAAFYCPHRPDECCDCRKPAPGMLLAACRLFGIAPGETAFIGDRDSDVEAAANVGCGAIRLLRDVGLAGAPSGESAARVFGSLLDAVLNLFPRSA